MMGLACLFMVACDNAPQQEQPKQEPEQTAAVAEEHQCPFCALKAEYANWENMAEDAKKALNEKAAGLFAEMDAKMEEMKAEGKECCEKKAEEVVEMTEEMKTECEAKKAECEAKCAEMKAKWEGFAEKSLDEQKDLVLERIAAMGMGQCKHDAEGEGHECKHEGEHQCQKAAE